jgi:hypothetical protein
MLLMEPSPLHTALAVVEGPLFRVAVAILVLGIARHLFLMISDVIGARLTTGQRGGFWPRVWLRVTWALFPAALLRRVYPNLSAGAWLYHAGLSVLSLITVAGAVALPLFMAAHVELWKSTLGVGWPAMPGVTADVLAIVTIVAGFLLFLGRLYSPLVRHLDPPWSFIKPLILILPFLTGFLAMHPTFSPLSYTFVRLLHVLFAEIAFVLVPFGRLLWCMHTPITQILPEAQWPAVAHPEMKPA